MSSMISVVTLLTAIFTEEPDGSGGEQQPILSQGDRVAVENITRLIERYHLSKKSLDDTMSEALLTEFVSCLDPERRYFLSEDIAEFDKSRHSLDDAIKMCDMAVFETIYRRYLQRSGELDKKLDSTLDELSRVTPGALAALNKTTSGSAPVTAKMSLLQGWPQDKAQQERRWKRQLLSEIKRLEKDGSGEKEALEKIGKRFHGIQINRQNASSNQLASMVTNAVAHCFDPHSAYLDSNETKEFDIGMNLSLSGIGVSLTHRDGATKVKGLISGGSAEGKLQAGDILLAAAEEDQDMAPIPTNPAEVKKILRGLPGTQVKVQVQRNSTTLEFLLERRELQLQETAASGRMIKDGLGLVKLPSFYAGDKKSCSADLAAQIEKLKEVGLRSLILDMRDNGGGSLDEAIKVAGLFIDQGPIVQVQYRGQGVAVLNDDDAGLVWDGPLVVLVNGGTASSAEIVAAAIQDYQRGVIVGAQTYGKGTVQRLLNLNGLRNPLTLKAVGGSLAVTVARFYRINGSSTQIQGVKPDIVLDDDVEWSKEEDLANPLKWQAVTAAKYVKIPRKATFVTDLRRQVLATKQPLTLGNDTYVDAADKILNFGAKNGPVLLATKDSQSKGFVHPTIRLGSNSD